MPHIQTATRRSLADFLGVVYILLTSKHAKALAAAAIDEPKIDIHGHVLMFSIPKP